MFLHKKMKGKLNDGYAHTLEWWKPVSSPALWRRAGYIYKKWPRGLGDEPPSESELLERFENEWDALDVFVGIRDTVFDEGAYKKKVSEMQKESYFTCVTDALAELDLIDELAQEKYELLVIH